MSGVENPPAFPSHYGDPELTDPRNRVSCGGMTLRDYFAGQAIVGFMAMLPHLRNVAAKDGREMDEAWFAENAYTVADAMLAARGAS